MDDQEEVARLFGKYNLVAAPVVDTANRLVGVITIDDVVDVIEEEADEDLKALGGVTSDEELSDNVWTIAKGRFNWLLVNLATAFLASSVLGLFEGQLEKMVALAVLAPIVASQGGNAATQTMTVAVRALATRELGPNNAYRVVMREGLVGLVNGLAFAVITGIAAVAWFKIPGARRRDRPRHGVQPDRRRARRHSDSDGAGAGAGRSGGGVGHLRHHHHRRGRLLLVPRHRHAVVRAEIERAGGPRIVNQTLTRIADTARLGSRGMQRLRLKADGRIVELRDGQEFPLAPAAASAGPAPADCGHACLRCATCAAARA